MTDEEQVGFVYKYAEEAIANTGVLAPAVLIFRDGSELPEIVVIQANPSYDFRAKMTELLQQLTEMGVRRLFTATMGQIHPKSGLCVMIADVKNTKLLVADVNNKRDGIGQLRPFDGPTTRPIEPTILFTSPDFERSRAIAFQKIRVLDAKALPAVMGFVNGHFFYATKLAVAEIGRCIRHLFAVGSHHIFSVGQLPSAVRISEFRAGGTGLQLACSWEAEITCLDDGQEVVGELLEVSSQPQEDLH